MADSTLLTSISKKAINEFRKDLLEMLRCGKEMDRYYGEANPEIDSYMKKFNSLVNLFNKKYKNLSFKLVKKVDNLELKMLLNENNVKDVFANSASKIIGLQSIGTKTSGTAMVSTPDQFSDQLNKAKDKLFITYYNPQTGKSTVFLQYDKKTKKVQLVYGDDIENEPSAEFQIAAFYALQDYNEKIKLTEEAATLGFTLWPEHKGKAEYYGKFDPHLTE